MAGKHAFDTATLLGVPVASVTMDEVMDVVNHVIATRDQLHVGVVNAAKMVNMGRNPELREDVLSSDIILADGAAVILASKVLGQPLPERVTGIDLMYRILAAGQKPGYRVYLLGASEAVSAEVERRIGTQYPGVIVAGRRNGYFTDDEAEAVAQDIHDSKPDVLFVAITSPKKERFLARFRDLIQVSVIHGVGGSFDVFSGLVERAPETWQKLGLEWLYRAAQEPRRLGPRYLSTNFAFLWLLTKAWCARLAGR